MLNLRNSANMASAISCLCIIHTVSFLRWHLYTFRTLSRSALVLMSIVYKITGSRKQDKKECFISYCDLCSVLYPLVLVSRITDDNALLCVHFWITCRAAITGRNIFTRSKFAPRMTVRKPWP